MWLFWFLVLGAVVLGGHVFFLVLLGTLVLNLKTLQCNVSTIYPICLFSSKKSVSSLKPFKIHDSKAWCFGSEPEDVAVQRLYEVF